MELDLGLWLIGWVIGGAVTVAVAVLVLVLILTARSIRSRAAAIAVAIEQTITNTDPLWQVGRANLTLGDVVEGVRQARENQER